DGIRDFHVTGVQTCALPIFARVGIDRYRAETGHAGVVGDEDAAILEEGGVTLELVDQRRGNQFPVVGIDDAEGADEGGDDTAAGDRKSGVEGKSVGRGGGGI